MIDDRWDALVPGGNVEVAGADDGPLAGRTFVAKDVFDVAGMRTGAGNPTRRATTSPVAASAVAVQRLLAAGATLVGRSRTDELAYGLSGRNELDGSPTNPAAPGHLTGGSSSGSAAAVAGGLAAIGLGTDTGGSIRVPASHCGLLRLAAHPRPGARQRASCPSRPASTPCGVAHRDGRPPRCRRARALRRVGAPGRLPSVASCVLDDVAAVASASIEEAVEAFGLPVDHVRLGRNGELDSWLEAFRALQGAEAWATHGRVDHDRHDPRPQACGAGRRFEAAPRA